jgi:hypothetical protein
LVKEEQIWPPPAALVEQTRSAAPDTLPNAILAPSGDQSGSSSWSGEPVSLVGFAPLDCML